jgi:type II secretory ATPase GspE/PulE/Tfp pilus assembly ATPase PilB-like protein
VATVETKPQPVRSTPAGRAPGRAEAAAQALHLDLRNKEPDLVVPELVEYAARLRASDLFFCTDEDCVEVSVRHLGLLRAIGTLSLDTGRRCISYIKTMADMDISEHRRGMDGRWLFNRESGRRLDLRINTIPTLHGEDCAVRLLDRDERLLELDQLGMEEPLYRYLGGLLNSPSGLLLVTGPMETGKSTTLYACLSYLNNGERKINTIEDPIEYSIKGLRQSQVNAKIGLTFDELLRGVLRQAPHVIMVGEIRDSETAKTAVGAANSGVLVLSTLHAPVASMGVHAMLRMGVHPRLLSESLLGILSQRLLRTLCPRCKVASEPPRARLGEDGKPWPEDSSSPFAARGCAECHLTGYSGLTALFEMFKISPEVRTLIDEAAPAPVLHRKAVEQGLIEFRRSARERIARGETTAEEMVRVLPAESVM